MWIEKNTCAFKQGIGNAHLFVFSTIFPRPCAVAWLWTHVINHSPCSLELISAYSAVFFSHNKSASARISQPETIHQTGWLFSGIVAANRSRLAPSWSVTQTYGRFSQHCNIFTLRTTYCAMKGTMYCLGDGGRWVMASFVRQWRAMCFGIGWDMRSKPGHSGYPKNLGRVIRVFKNATRCLSQNNITRYFGFGFG
jgi:hypothetical protein